MLTTESTLFCFTLLTNYFCSLGLSNGTECLEDFMDIILEQALLISWGFEFLRPTNFFLLWHPVNESICFKTHWIAYAVILNFKKLLNLIFQLHYLKLYPHMQNSNSNTALCRLYFNDPRFSSHKLVRNTNTMYAMYLPILPIAHLNLE